MDFNTFKQSSELMSASASVDFKVFIHTLDTAVLQDFILPYNEDAGRDTLYANCVFLLLDEGWVYITNLNCSPSSSTVKMYTSSKVIFEEPLDTRLVTLLNHYFLQRKYLRHYHIADASPFDKNDMILALFSCYSTVINNRFIRENLLSREDVVSNAIKHFKQSCEQENLLPFHRGIFRDMTEMLQPIKIFEILSDEELDTLRLEESKRRNPPRRFASASPQSSRHDNLDLSLSNEEVLPDLSSHKPTGVLLNERLADNPDDPSDDSSIVSTMSSDVHVALSNIDKQPVKCNNPARSDNECKQDLDKDELYENILKKEDKGLIKSYKCHMICHSVDCLANKNITRSVHYHCLRCKTFKYKDFFRVVHHTLNTCLAVPKTNRKTENKVSLNEQTDASYPSRAVEDSPSPVVDSPSLVVDSPSLVVDSSIPVVDSSIPVVDSSSPVVDSSSPVVDSSSPVVDSSIPVVDSSSPVVDSSIPVVDSSSPVVDSSIPVVDSSSPVVDSSIPVVDSSSPVVDSVRKDFIDANVVLSPDVRKCPGNDNEGCLKYIHYHCGVCLVHRHYSADRVNKHAIKCRSKRDDTVNVPHKPSGNHLQSVLIDPEQGLYLVRKSSQGPAHPLHVKVDCSGNMHCSSSECKDLASFQHHSLNPGFVCKHISACLNNEHSTEPDLFQSSLLSSSSFSKDAGILKVVEAAAIVHAPVIKQFVPVMKTKGTSSRYIYYSVYGNFPMKKYYSHFNRVLVSYDRDTKSLKCECSEQSCSHRKIAAVIVENDKVLQEIREDKVLDQTEVDRVDRMVDYVLKYKKIPFDVSDYLEEKLVTSFTPKESNCICGESLDELHTVKRGHIFTMFHKVCNIPVTTKFCKKCNLEFRYSEYEDGYFNFNNSSFFSIKFMEFLLASWVNNCPLHDQLQTLRQVSSIDYNENHILEAVKSYLALKKLDHMYCYRCGYYPVFLTYDAIRSVCFDLDPTEFNGLDLQTDTLYENFEELHEQSCKFDLARGYLNTKSPQYSTNLKNFSVKLCQHYPPYICPQNSGKVPKYTGGKIKHDKPEEIELPYERLQQILSSKKCSEQLVDICKSFKIDTRGGKAVMVKRILDLDNKAEFYSAVRKKFFSISGKSGGLLCGVCPHGNTYSLKHLTLPESVADYTNTALSFKVPPSVCFSDIASLFALHTNNHFPSFFRPYMGRIDDFTDPRSDLYKHGQKKALFDIKVHTSRHIDISKFDMSTQHPVSQTFVRLCLYDRFHEWNHNEIDGHLRRVDNTTLWHQNTQSAEQHNHLLGLTKGTLTQTDLNTYIKLSTYLVCVQNYKNNNKWRAKLEKQLKVKTELDDLGFLVKTGTRKDGLLNNVVEVPDTSNIATSSYPVANLVSSHPDTSAANLVTSVNSLVYLFAFSPMSEEISQSDPVKPNEFVDLMEYVTGKAIYDVAERQKLCSKLTESCEITSSTKLLPDILYRAKVAPLLLKSGVGVKYASLSNVDIGISLSQLLNQSETKSDYVVLSNNFKSMTFLTGARPHYDILNGDSSTRYKLAGYIVPIQGKHACFVDYDGAYYEVIDSNITVVSQQNFIESSRSSHLMLFKLVKSEKDNSSFSAQCKRKHDNNNDRDVFDFVDSLKPKVKRRKVDSSVTHILPEQPWLEASYSGRLELTSAQRRILDSPARWFDDVIINSYAMMCLHENRYSFVYQDTCLGNKYLLGSFKSVDEQFIQILNIDNAHWICASNALTYRNEPNVVELFDSLATPKMLESSSTLNSYVATFVLQLRPMTECIRYVQTQYQGNSSDCGPFSLAFLWALSKGCHPKQFEYNLNGPGIRRKVKDSIQSDMFVPPTLVRPRNVRKHILKSFDFDNASKAFKCSTNLRKVSKKAPFK